jgi:hypothetical protein
LMDRIVRIDDLFFGHQPLFSPGYPGRCHIVRRFYCQEGRSFVSGTELLSEVWF